jgi:hypothetical protein
MYLLVQSFEQLLICTSWFGGVQVDPPLYLTFGGIEVEKSIQLLEVQIVDELQVSRFSNFWQQDHDVPLSPPRGCSSNRWVDWTTRTQALEQSGRHKLLIAGPSTV